GKHYRLRFVNTWPKPVQKPHPEVWIPGAGSLETLEFVARHRYAYMGIPYFHIRVFERQFRLFREACQREGYAYDPRQAGWLTPIYVADTDEQARAEYEEHWWYFVRRLLPGIEISPPGYTSLRSVENILRGLGTFASSLTTWARSRCGGAARDRVWCTSTRPPARGRAWPSWTSWRRPSMSWRRSSLASGRARASSASTTWRT